MKANKEPSPWQSAGIALLAILGFLLPFWPLAALAVVLAGIRGRIVLALALGLLLDLMWGAPGGIAGFVQFPLTILALLGLVLQKGGEWYVFPKSSPQRLY